MTIEYTFSMIKPDATKRNITGKINSYLENAGLKIVAQKLAQLSKKDAEEFYAEHKARSFFGELIAEITSGPVVLQVLKAEDAIALNRKVMGATNPLEAEEGTIRRDLALSIGSNSVHGSDSLIAAQREIAFFFAGFKILN
jgi:nucleoside-diphosphate kinase